VSDRRSDLMPPDAPEPERKLAAIMSADVVGYSRMMSLDEAGTLARFGKARREAIDPVIEANRGRVFKVMGDGLLVEFPSVVLALRAALTMQSRLLVQAAALPPDHRIMLRIGLHQGDVVVLGDDLLGDGVNIAARLEPLADPGGICMSARVREDAAGKIPLEAQDGGERLLKNIAQPVRVYFIRPSAVLADATTSAPLVPPGLAASRAAAAEPADADERTIVALPEPRVHELVLFKARQPGVSPGQVVLLGAKPLAVGRLAPNDLILPNSEVSRAHCRFELVADSAIVTDLGSTNGTFVDDERIVTPTRLHPGSLIRIGPYVWRYRCKEAEPADADRTVIMGRTPG
jgi:adenylate cyclase